MDSRERSGGAVSRGRSGGAVSRGRSGGADSRGRSGGADSSGRSGSADSVSSWTGAGSGGAVEELVRSTPSSCAPSKIISA